MKLKTRLGTIDLSVLPPHLASALMAAYEQKYRIRLWYGDTDTGLAWNEFYDVMGTVCATYGISPILILVANRRSTCGGAILVNNIVRVDCIAEKRTLYAHPNFHVMANEDAGFSQRDIEFLTGKVYKK